MLTLALRSLIRDFVFSLSRSFGSGACKKMKTAGDLLTARATGCGCFSFSRAHHSKFVEEKENKNVCGQTKISAYWISGTGSRSLTANKTWVWGPK